MTYANQGREMTEEGVVRQTSRGVASVEFIQKEA